MTRHRRYLTRYCEILQPDDDLVVVESARHGGRMYAYIRRFNLDESGRKKQNGKFTTLGPADCLALSEALLAAREDLIGRLPSKSSTQGGDDA